MVLITPGVSITNHDIHISYMFSLSLSQQEGGDQGRVRRAKTNLANYGRGGFV